MTKMVSRSIVVATFLKFQGNNFLLSSKLFSAHFHLNSSSNHDHPLSNFPSVTNLDDALNLFDEMSHRQPLPSVGHFTQLLNSVTKMKHFSSSLHLFNQMCSLGLPVNIYTMNIAIKCCCELYRTNDGFALLGCCFKRRITPDVYTFNTLLNGLILEDRILEAERLFTKLIKKKLCVPNVVTYSTMIKGLRKIGNNVTATALLRLMDESGCKPNVIVYNIVISSLAKDKMVDAAFRIFKEMVLHKGIPPDAVAYNSLIYGLCNLGRWGEVSMMLKQMEEKMIYADVHTFNMLIDVFCKEGKVGDAINVIKIMVKRGIVPDIVTYNSLINGYCLHGDMSKAKIVFDSMVGKGKGFLPDVVIVPDIVTYNSLINGYCLHGDMSKAKIVFDSMVCKGLLPDVVTYTTLLNGYCKNLKIDEAMNVFREIIKKGLKPNAVTYNTMVQGLVEARCYEAAHKFFDEMEAQGHVPNEYTCRMMKRVFTTTVK